MSRGIAGRVAWSLWGLTMTITALVIRFRPGELELPADVFPFLVIGATATIGAVVAGRVQDNPLGWIFLGLGFFWAFSGAIQWMLESAGSAAGEDLAAWLGSWGWVPVILVPPTFVLLLFPDGKLPSSRWRPVAWAAAIGIAAFSFEMAFGPYLGGTPEYGPNPYHLGGHLRIVSWGALLLIPALIGSVAAVIVRFRRRHGTERQQIKLLAYSGVVALASIASVSTIEAVRPGTLPSRLSDAVILAAITLIPVAMTLAILRYRLYDIDRLISRTVSYALLTGVLVGTYVAAVLLLSRAFATVGAGGDLAVAAATLAAAAIFHPARRRIQASVERRFYRSRYDAQQTLEAFAARLRDEVDLDALSEDLVGVVTQTMHPEHTSLWLPPGQMAR